ncbi:MAG: FAD-binding oxidoreductase, partial [Chlamydiia bacterium]|nr:FAD-binding oxidoreductase [Chlamydiia bacterium]
TLDEFLWEHRKEFPFHDKEVRIALHGHCHQKALVGMEKTLEFLRAHPKSHVELIPSGCCGMAGAFGYEKEHYPLSVKIANLQLIPYLKGCPEETLIVASGFSCRTQIADLTQKRALHLAEAAYSLLK